MNVSDLFKIDQILFNLTFNLIKITCMVFNKKNGKNLGQTYHWSNDCFNEDERCRQCNR